MANIARWEPFDDNLLDIFPTFFGRPSMARSTESVMRMDVAETDRDYRICIEIPGVPKAAIQVSIDRNKVTIAAERVEEKPVGEKPVAERADWILRERSTGKVSRTLALPDAVDESKAEAKHIDGVLYLTLPKHSGTMKRLTIH